jgi:hypothetical protein
MPPINFPDPPFQPTVAAPGSGSGGTHTAAPAAITLRKAGGTQQSADPAKDGNETNVVTGTKQPGAACAAGSHYGTVVLSSGKYVCNFTPSTLPAGAACHYNSTMGTVTVVDGKRYCKI